MDGYNIHILQLIAAITVVFVGFYVYTSEQKLLKVENNLTSKWNEFSDIHEEVNKMLHEQIYTVMTEVNKLQSLLSAEQSKGKEQTETLTNKVNKLQSWFAAEQAKASVLPRECSDIQTYNRTSGVHIIYPFGKLQPAVSVYCHEDNYGQFWTVIQRRFNGTVNFYRGWQEYKNGFGKPQDEYWLGNDMIHVLTTSYNHALMIEMSDFSKVTKYAKYHTFAISSEDNGYRLDISKYDGTAGDSLSNLNGQKFTTFDKDNDAWDKNCAVVFKGAWWYSNCHSSNLNGLYHAGHHAENATGINWQTWHKHNYSLKTTMMMIRKY